MLAGVNRSLLLFLLVPLFVLIFAGLWLLIPLLLARLGGWSRLAERFPAPGPANGTAFRWQSARLGLINYNNCLTIHISPEGLYLAVTALLRAGHWPVLIPWKDIHDAKSQRMLWAEYVSFDVGAPIVARLRLSKSIFEAASKLAPDIRPA
jgi:hypothetical protein